MGAGLSIALRLDEEPCKLSRLTTAGRGSYVLRRRVHRSSYHRVDDLAGLGGWRSNRSISMSKRFDAINPTFDAKLARQNRSDNIGNAFVVADIEDLLTVLRCKALQPIQQLPNLGSLPVSEQMDHHRKPG